MYVFWLLTIHYFVMGQPGRNLLFWATAFIFGIILIWWIVDAIRMPKLIRDYNRDLAIDTMRNMKAIWARN